MQNSANKPQLTLYGHPHSRVGRVLWMLHELELPHSLELIDFFDSDHDEENGGNRRVPFLVDESSGAKIFESLAINTWLVQTYGESSRLSPRTSREWGDFFKWSYWSMTELDMLLFEGLMYNDEIGHVMSASDLYEGYFDRPKTEQRRLRIRRELEFPFSVLESTLKGGDGWLLGTHFTAADLNVASVAFWIFFQGHADIGAFTEQHPAVANWLGRCMEREHSPLNRMFQDQASGDPSVKIDWVHARPGAEVRSLRAGSPSR